MSFGQEPQALLEEALDAEVVVDLNKLKEAARRGVPPQYRSTLYRYFLGVASVDKSGEMSSSQWQEAGWSTLLSSTSLASASSRLETLSMLPKQGFSATIYLLDAPRRMRFIKVIDALRVAHTFVSAELMCDFISIAAVFDSVFQHGNGSAQDVFYCSEAVISMLCCGNNVLSDSDALRRECARFLTLFRTTNPELYHHFIREGVPFFEWLPRMLTALLSTNLHEDDLLRLWDNYLSDALVEGGFPMHSFVCLALLDYFREQLVELDKMEILTFLSAFPRLNVDRVFQEARQIREFVRSRGLV